MQIYICYFFLWDDVVQRMEMILDKEENNVFLKEIDKSRDELKILKEEKQIL